MEFHWNGQGGQPPWIWGGSDGVNMYVYNPSNFSVNYANQSHLLRSYQPDSWGGGSYGDAFQIKSQYDGTFFCLKCVDSNYAVKVDRADWAQPVFNNATWYTVGDDVRIGDQNVGGALCLQGITGTSGLRMLSKNGVYAASLLEMDDSTFGLYGYNAQVVVRETGRAYLQVSSYASVVNINNNAFMPIYASAFTINSSRLVKENIVDMTDDEAKKILNLRVVDFDYINGKKGQCGLIAEEVIDILPYCVDIPEDYSEEKALEQIANGELPDVPGIDYSKLVAPLIKLVQMQQEQIELLTHKVDELINFLKCT